MAVGIYMLQYTTPMSNMDPEATDRANHRCLRCDKVFKNIGHLRRHEASRAYHDNCSAHSNTDIKQTRSRQHISANTAREALVEGEVFQGIRVRTKSLT
jgi:hypothetical protein